MDNYNYDSSFNIRLYLFWTGEWIIDVEKEQPDLLGKHGLGRELTNKRGVEPRFIGRKPLPSFKIYPQLYPLQNAVIIAHFWVVNLLYKLLI